MEMEEDGFVTVAKAGATRALLVLALVHMPARAAVAAPMGPILTLMFSFGRDTGAARSRGRRLGDRRGSGARDLRLGEGVERGTGDG